jgi:hypothetical protein
MIVVHQKTLQMKQQTRIHLHHKKHHSLKSKNQIVKLNISVVAFLFAIDISNC